MSSSKQGRPPSSEGEETGPTFKRCNFTRVRGNTIYCSQRDRWNTVSAVKVRTEEAASSFKIAVLHSKFTFLFEPEFVIPTEQPFFPLSAVSREMDFAAKMRCEALSYLPNEKCLKLTPIAPSQGTPAVTDSESGDDAPPEFSIAEKFTESLDCLRLMYEQLHCFYHEAKECDFHNAQGKYFMQSFLQFLLPDDFTSRLSTSPHGDRQPGACEVTWVVKNKARREAAISETCNTQERVADVVAYHTAKCYFAVVVEIKSKEEVARAQQFEQMVGLFHPQQAVMLGLTVEPKKTSPRILRRI